MLTETAFPRKSPHMLLREKGMTLRGTFLVLISYIVSCFVDEFQREKEECLFSFYHHFL